MTNYTEWLERREAAEAAMSTDRVEIVLASTACFSSLHS